MSIELPNGRAAQAEKAANAALRRLIEKVDEMAVSGWLPLRVDSGAVGGDMAAAAVVSLHGVFDGVDLPRSARCIGCGKLVPFDVSDLRKLRVCAGSGVVAEIRGIQHCGLCDVTVLIQYLYGSWCAVPQTVEHLH